MKLVEILVAGLVSGAVTGLVINHVENKESYKSKPDCNQASNSYVIRSGDTLWGIAQAYGTTIPDLKRFNPNIKEHPHHIRAGERICVPNFSPLYQVDTAPRKYFGNSRHR